MIGSPTLPQATTGRSPGWRRSGDAPVKITFKLFATLADHLPPEARRTNQIELVVPDGATLDEVIAPYNLPQKLVHLVLVNGVFVPFEARATRALADGDALAIWPPVAGG